VKRTLRHKLKPPASAAAIAGAVSVKDFGAVPDDRTEQSAHIQAAIDSLPVGGGEIFVPKGIYKCERAPLTLRDNVVLVGEGRATVIETSVSAADFAIIQALGTMEAGQALSADAAIGTLQLNVLGPSRIAPGDWLHLNSSLTVGFTDQPQGEIVRVLAVVGDTITLYDPLCDSYAMADGAQIQKLNPVVGAGVRNLALRGPADTTFRTAGIHAELCHDFTVSGVKCERTQYAGVALFNTWASRVHDCYFKDIEKPGLAYGVVVGWASQDILISSVIGERVRHLVTVGGGLLNRGNPRRITTKGATATNMLQAGFDCHPCGEDIIFDDCHVLGSDVDGFMFQGTSGMIVNSTARGCGRHGLVLQPLTKRHCDVAVHNFRAVDCPNGKGVTLSTAAPYDLWRSVKISGITAVRCINGIHINTTEATAVSGLAIDGVRVESCSSHAVVVARANSYSLRGISAQSGVRAVVILRSSYGNLTAFDLEGTSTKDTIGIQCIAVTNTVFSAIRGRGFNVGLSFDSACNTNTIDGSVDFRGCTTQRSLSTGLNNLTGIRSDDPRLIALSIAASYVEQRRTSDCFTLPVTNGGTPLPALASGGMLAALAYSLVDGTFTRIAWCASTGTIAGLTDFRLGVWNPVAGAYLAQTANEAANVVANSLMTFDLLKPVVAVAGQPLLLTIGGLGTTLPIIRGAIMGAAQAGRLTLAGYRSCTLATGWTGGDLPRPGMGSTGGIPWIELM